MKKTVLLIVAFFLFASFSSAFAEMKTFIKEYTYQAGEIDSKISCRIIALEQVKRLLLEEIGIYLESQTEVKNFRLTKDEITVLTAGIVRAEIIEEKWDGNTLKYWLKAKITADPSSVVTSIDSLRKDRQKMRELEIIRGRSNNLTTEIEQLGKELAVSNPDPAKVSQYNSALKKLSASDYMEKGIFLIKEGKNDEAIEAFTATIERDSSFGKAYSYLGGAAIDSKKYHLAIDYASKAIALDPSDELAYKVRGWSYFELRQYQKAIEDLSAAINIVPKDADLYKRRGNVFMEIGDYKMAVEDFSKAINIVPKDADLYSRRGDIFMEIGDYKMAVEDFSKVIELEPNKGYLYARRAVAYEKLGKYKQAAEDYHNSVSGPVSNVPLPLDLFSWDSMHRFAYEYTFNADLMNKINLYAKQGQYKKAIDLLSREIKNDPKNVDVIVRRGDIYALTGNHRLAVKDYSRAIKLKSDNKSPYLYFHRSKSYKAMGAYKDAVSDFKTALDIESSERTGSAIINKESYFNAEMQKCIRADNLDPQSMENCFQLVLLTSDDEKDCQSSINFLSKVIELKPEYASRAYCVRANLYVLRVKNYQQAIEDYSKGIDLDINYPQTESIGCIGGYSGRAHAYYLSGNYQRAIEDYSKDIEANPKHSSYSYYQRGDAYMKLKKYSLAIQDYTKAIETDRFQKEGHYLTVINIYTSRGSAYREAGYYQKAVEDYTKAIDLSRKKITNSVSESIPFVSPLLYIQRGDVYVLSGNNQQAIQDYSKILESDPKNAVAMRKRGYVYNKLGRHKLAVDDLRMAATLGDGEARDYLRKNEIEW